MKWLVLLPFAVFSYLSLGTNSFYQETVLPFYNSHPGGYVKGVGGAELYYKKFERAQSRGAIVFVTGWTETHLKYAQTIYDFVQAGYSVYSMDHRGMGFSTRLTNNPQQVHVEAFDHYVVDLRRFIERIVKPTNPSHLYFVSHSMGGLVVARYLDVFPDTKVDAAIYSAPLFQVQTGKYPEWVAYSIAATYSKLGMGTKYLLTDKDTTFEEAAQFENQTSTHSQENWERKTDNWRRFPVLLQGGSTNLWLKTVLETTGWLGKKGLRPDVPTRIFQATEDTRVVNSVHHALCAKLKDCRVLPQKNAYHELFLEVDAIRNSVMDESLQFLASHE